MRERGPRLSAKKEPLFKDAKSAVITISVVTFLVAFALFAINHNDESRLKKAAAKALGFQEEAYTLIEERFELARTMGRILVEEGFDDPFGEVVGSWDAEEGVEETSRLYNEVETLLDGVQKRFYNEPSFPRLIPYFEGAYHAELALVPWVEEYNSQVDFFNATMGSFPASIAAKRLKLERLARFSVASALKGRP